MNEGYLRAVILCSDIYPFSNTLFPLLTVGNNVPLLHYHLKFLEHQGIRKITLVTNHEDKLRCVFGTGASYNARIDYMTYCKAGIGATLKKIPKEQLKDKFILMRDEFLTFMNLRDIIAKHEQDYSTVTICIQTTKKWNKEILPDGLFNFCINGFYLEKVDSIKDIGIYILSTSVLDYMPVSDEIFEEIFPSIIKYQICLNGYPLSPDDLCFDLRNPKEAQYFMAVGYQLADQKLKHG